MSSLPARIQQSSVKDSQPESWKNGDKDDAWFFNVRVNKPGARHNQPLRTSLDLSDMTRSHRTDKNAQLNRRGKLPSVQKASPKTSSAVHVHKKTDMQATSSLGDNIILHNIPKVKGQECSPREEVVNFLKNYLLGMAADNVRLTDVQRMDKRFGKDGPITARLNLDRPVPVQQSDIPDKKIVPLAWLPPVHRQKLPKKHKYKTKTIIMQKQSKDCSTNEH